MRGLLEFLSRRPRSFIIGAALLIVLAVGLADYLSGIELVFSVFYLVAVALAVWFAGKGWGVVVSMFSVATWLGGDLAAGAHYAAPTVAVWNAVIALAFYLVVVWLLSSFSSLHRELEARVRQRTAALTDEMAERERLERELLEISEREQRRIGHDLHDGLCQHLTGTALAAQVLAGRLMSRDLPEARDANKLVELTEEGIDLSRKLAKGLHPVEMQAEGLMQALEESAATTSELFKVACRFECDSPVLIRDAGTAGHLYRIAQEAISNSIKHGKARNVVIQLEALEDGIALRVQDDGMGLPEPLPKNPGMGLRIMAHRAGMIGAAFSARRGESGGTVVACILRQKDKMDEIARE